MIHGQACLSWPLWLFIGLARFIEDAHILRCSLKWPNDILYDNRKLAGILLEASAEGVVVGCGINLANAPVLDIQIFRLSRLTSWSPLSQLTPKPLLVRS